MRGTSDEEMADIFGIPNKLIKQWKKTYPSFEQAIAEGRTEPTVQVIQALHQRAIGYNHPETKVHFDGGEHGSQKWKTLNITKHHPPEMKAINMWLTNQQPDLWLGERSHVSVSGGKGVDSPIGIKNETKVELVNSILALIQPKSDDPAED